MAKKKQARVIFRGERGRFVSPKVRYTSKVKQVQIKRGDRYVTVLEKKTPSPKILVDLLNQREFESLPEAIMPFKVFKPHSKYAAWNLAEQLDKAKGIRRKQLKITLELMDGQRLKRLTFYHIIKKNQTSSYQLFRRINEEIGFEGLQLYNQIRGKMIADRKGKQVRLIKAIVETVI